MRIPGTLVKEDRMTRKWLLEARAWLVPLVLVLAASSVLARAGDGIYQPPKDYAKDWARNITLFLTVTAMGVILCTLLFRRRLAGFQSRWLLFLGICVTPAPVMVLSSAVGLEQAKAVDFCKSCHVMGSFIADMEHPASGRLAALHFKNRYIQDHHCYTCHTDYGLFGTVEAKIGGLAHIWRETAGTYRLPVRMKEGYRFTICLNCHGQSQKFIEQKAHAGIVERILGGETTCTACHGPSHPPGQERG